MYLLIFIKYVISAEYPLSFGVFFLSFYIPNGYIWPDLSDHE